MILGFVSSSAGAQDSQKFCDDISKGKDSGYCEVAQAARAASEICEACNDDLASIYNIFHYDLPVETIEKHCRQLNSNSESQGVADSSAGSSPSGNQANESNDQFCADPAKFVCEDEDSYKISPTEVIDSLNSQQKKNSWMGFFYARNNNSIELAKPIAGLNPRSAEFKNQVFIGENNDSNLITSFSSEALSEFSSDGNKSTGAREVKKKVSDKFSDYSVLLAETSMATHPGFQKRAQRLNENFEEILMTPDEYLGAILPQPLPQAWKNEEGKQQFVNVYSQYTTECGSDGLKPKMFFSRFKDGTDTMQERLVMCPGFILAQKNSKLNKGSEGEVLKAVSSFMTVPESSKLRGASLSPDEVSEGADSDEKLLVNCMQVASGFETCYPKPTGDDVCNNHASSNLDPSQKLANEMLDKVIAQKSLKGEELKTWMKENLKGSCGRTFAPAFSSKMREVLSCESGMEFSNACLANGAKNTSTADEAVELSCDHICLNTDCNGLAPRLVFRDTLNGHFGAASGLNGVAPVSLGTSFRSGKMCAYNKNGANAFQAPMPLGFKCGSGEVAGYCNSENPDKCLKTWQARGQWSGVSCYSNNGERSIPRRINRAQILSVQQAKLDQKCQEAEVRYQGISSRRLRYHNGREAPSGTIGSEVEAHRNSDSSQR
tara:strand:+ start:1146 stop:3131 length:1986 start_codon:yes stop_codon:yes gene_type:complete